MIPPEPPPGPAEPKRLWASGQELARAALEELSSGAGQLRTAGLGSPPRSARGRSFVHGFLLPFLIARRLWRSPEERGRYLKVTLWQLVITLAFSLPLVLLSSEWRESASPPEQLRADAALARGEAGRLRLLAEEEAGVLLPFVHQQLLLSLSEEATEAQERVAEAREDATRAARRAEEAAAKAKTVTGTPEATDAAERVARLQARATEAEQEVQEALLEAEQAEAAVRELTSRLPGAASVPTEAPLPRAAPAGADQTPESLARQVAQLEQEALLEAESDEARLALLRDAFGQHAAAEEQEAALLEAQAKKIDDEGGFLIHRGLLFWAKLFSVVYVVQTLVIWLSREFHDQLESRSSRLIGMPPEELVERPRVRINLRWVRKKLKRRWRAIWIFGTGIPLIYLLAAIFPSRLGVSSLLSGLWFAYWWVVWSAAKTSYAWAEAPTDPWYLRGWDALSRRLPFLKWYGRTWRRFTQSVFAPAACVEQQPWTMAGLGLARGLGSVPVLKIFLRPFFPVASALLIEERRGRLFASSELVEPVVDAQPLEDEDDAPGA